MIANERGAILAALNRRFCLGRAHIVFAGGRSAPEVGSSRLRLAGPGEALGSFTKGFVTGLPLGRFFHYNLTFFQLMALNYLCRLDRFFCLEPF